MGVSKAVAVIESDNVNAIFNLKHQAVVVHGQPASLVEA